MKKIKWNETKTVDRTRCAVVYVIYYTRAVRSLMRFYVYTTPCKRVRSARITEFFDWASFHDWTTRFFLRLSLIHHNLSLSVCVLLAIVCISPPRIPNACDTYTNTRERARLLMNTNIYTHAHASLRIIIRAAAVPNSRVVKSEKNNKEEAVAAVCSRTIIM